MITITQTFIKMCSNVEKSREEKQVSLATLEHFKLHTAEVTFLNGDS